MCPCQNHLQLMILHIFHKEARHSFSWDWFSAWRSISKPDAHTCMKRIFPASMEKIPDKFIRTTLIYSTQILPFIHNSVLDMFHAYSHCPQHTLSPCVGFWPEDHTHCSTFPPSFYPSSTFRSIWKPTPVRNRVCMCGISKFSSDEQKHFIFPQGSLWIPPLNIHTGAICPMNSAAPFSFLS